MRGIRIVKIILLVLILICSGIGANILTRILKSEKKPEELSDDPAEAE